MQKIAQLFLSLMLAFAANFLPPSKAEAQVLPANLTSGVLISESGHAVRLSDYRGKVLFINFWGSWCSPCLQEMASIRNLQARLGDRRNDIAFIFISTKASHFAADTAWLRQNGISGLNFRWGSGSPGVSVPTTFILDQSGAVAQFKNTAIDWEMHTESIRSLLTRGWRA